MNAQTAIPLDSVIWAIIVAYIAWFLFAEQQKKHGNIMSVLVALFATVIYTFFVVIVDTNLMKHINISETQGEIISFLGWIAGGLLAAINAVIFNKRANAQIQVAGEQAENNRLTEEGHIQDRFKAATEHLGHARPGMRIAAYYEFYQLAQKNPDLRKIILEMLCAHLRQITNASNYEGKKKPTEGVQTLLDLLFKKSESKEIFQGLKANLQRVHLVGANLFQAHMPGADFSRACLIEADMRLAKLYHCDFGGAIMDGVYLDNAEMIGAMLGNAKLRGAILRNTNMQMAKLGNGTDFRGAFMHQTQMQEIFLMSVPTGPYLHLGGVFNNASYDDYKSTIRGRHGKKGYIYDIVFSGDYLVKQHITEISEHLSKYVSEKSAEEYRRCMSKHVDCPQSPELPFGCNESDRASYTTADADKWIAEYKRAMGDGGD